MFTFWVGSLFFTPSSTLQHYHLRPALFTGSKPYDRRAAGCSAVLWTGDASGIGARIFFGFFNYDNKAPGSFQSASGVQMKVHGGSIESA